MKTGFRSHTSAQICLDLIGQEVTVCGWVHNVRDLGGLVFIDLRDHYGIIQVVSDEATLTSSFRNLKKESVVQIKGVVQKKVGEENTEIKATSLRLLSESAELPFSVNQETDVSEQIRLQYRFLHLRRQKQHQQITKRSYLIKLIRDILFERKFLEIQTPILTGTSPEGARDFLVPSRRFKGKFYALPQAPQQFKQLLMMSGFDRYFQIAPCFRDEDPRADRHAGEFYQIDAEMAFVTQEDVLQEFESFFVELLTRFGVSKIVSEPFYRMSFDETIVKTGSDKPDLRCAVFYTNMSNFEDLITVDSLSSKGNDQEFLACLKFSLQVYPTRKILDQIVELGRQLGFSVFYLLQEGENFKGTLAKFIRQEFLEILKETNTAFARSNITLYVFLKRKLQLEPTAEEFRIKVAKILNQFDENKLAFCWITDFPFYELDEFGNLQFCHNPFSMPQGGLEALKSQDPLKIKAFQYDLALNGFELSSGAIRNHELETLLTAFELIGYPREKTLKTFPGITNALRFGPPPHGGMAPGIERLLMILFDEPNVREVIPFPLNQNGQDLLMNAPSEVDDDRLQELGLRLAGN
ncbi:MAG: aspartate--tRNA ligase [Deltaproteobacteria bacterium]|nr:aspartate--tRNA ligase [Deltaproteobacteria bacterium]